MTTRLQDSRMNTDTPSPTDIPLDGFDAAAKGFPPTANPFDAEHALSDYEWWDYRHCAFRCDRAVDEGALARSREQPLSACPYTFEAHGNVYQAWYHGWEEMQKVADVAAIIRKAIEPGLSVCATSGKPIAAGACLHASVLLAKALNRTGRAGASVRGGSGADGSSGARDTSGRWHGHYWVEAAVSYPSSCFIDITADQFGWPAVRILTTADAGDDYRPGPQDEVDDAVRDLAKEFGIEPREVGLD